MIKRIVRMEFQPDRVDDFLAVFDATSSQIRHFPGVQALELHRDHSNPHVFYTYSVWDNAESLEAYRVSPLFVNVWSKTKVLFAGKPIAYSLETARIVD